MSKKTIYTLHEIFCDDNKLIIPDLQRDYCWADCNLVEQFVKGLLDQFLGPYSTKKPLNMGLIYWYKGLDGFWQLCDGQQRMTTLFLCIGILNKRCQGNPFSDILISPFELHNDDKEPRLQYAIRESSLYFLSDLVCNFFLSDKIKNSSEISKQPWFYQEYKLDPSINNYLAALATIEHVTDNLDCLGFGKYLANNLLFYCYDMGKRKDGEETFVIINTTGEPLTQTENLKPQIIQENKGTTQNIDKRWEEIERFFWKNRGDNDTCDPGLDEFLRVLSLYHTYEIGLKEDFYNAIKNTTSLFDYHSIHFEEIEKFLEAFKVFLSIRPLVDSEASRMGLFIADSHSPYSQRQLFSLLPTMHFIIHHEEANDIDIKRVHHLFSNISRYQSIGTDDSSVSVWDGLKFAESIKDNDIAKLVSAKTYQELASEPRRAVFPFEEKIKLWIIKDSPERELIEEKFAEAEDYWLFDGEIEGVVSSSIHDNVYSHSSFVSFFTNTKRLWDNESSNRLRRALLTLNLQNYPPIYRGTTRCLGKRSEDIWKRIFKNNCKQVSFIKFIQDLPDEADTEDYLRDIIYSYTDVESTVYPLVHNGDYVNYCRDRFLIIGDHIILLNPKLQASGWRYLFDGIEIQLTDDGFGRCFIWNDNVLFVDHTKYDVAIDLVYHGQGNYQIDIFERGYEWKPKFLKLNEKASLLGLQHVDNRMKYFSSSLDDIIDKYIQLRNIMNL